MARTSTRGTLISALTLGLMFGGWASSGCKKDERISFAKGSQKVTAAGEKDGVAPPPAPPAPPGGENNGDRRLPAASCQKNEPSLYAGCAESLVGEGPNRKFTCSISSGFGAAAAAAPVGAVKGAAVPGGQIGVESETNPDLLIGAADAIQCRTVFTSSSKKLVIGGYYQNKPNLKFFLGPLNGSPTLALQVPGAIVGRVPRSIVAIADRAKILAMRPFAGQGELSEGNMQLQTLKTYASTSMGPLDLILLTSDNHAYIARFASAKTTGTETVPALSYPGFSASGTLLLSTDDILALREKFFRLHTCTCPAG